MAYDPLVCCVKGEDPEPCGNPDIQWNMSDGAWCRRCNHSESCCRAACAALDAQGGG